MLVACQLVNLTDWERQAKEAFREIREAYVLPEQLAAADRTVLQDVLRPLGFFRRRARSLTAFASAWVDRGPPADASKVPSYPGCGQYARDSWAIFVDGRTDVRPTDGKLLWHMERLHDGRDDPTGAAVPRGGDGDARPRGPDDARGRP
jgi:endonuclease III